MNSSCAPEYTAGNRMRFGEVGWHFCLPLDCSFDFSFFVRQWISAINMSGEMLKILCCIQKSCHLKDNPGTATPVYPLLLRRDHKTLLYSTSK